MHCVNRIQEAAGILAIAADFFGKITIGDAMRHGYRVVGFAADDALLEAPYDEAENRQQEQAQRSGNQDVLPEEAGPRRIGLGQRDFHADHAERGVFRSVVAFEAILAQILLDVLGRAYHMQISAASIRAHFDQFLTGFDDLAFQIGRLQVVARLADILGTFDAFQGEFARYHTQFAHRCHLLDLVEQQVPLVHRVGNHHGGEPGQGRIEKAERQIACLLDGRSPVLAAAPGDGAAQQERQHEEHRCRQTKPERHFAEDIDHGFVTVSQSMHKVMPL